MGKEKDNPILQNEKQNKSRSRRQFLKGLAATGAAAVAAPLVSPLVANADDTAPAAGNASQRLRRWVMVIDLRRCDGCSGQGTPPQCTQYCTWGRIVPEKMQFMEVFQEQKNALPGMQKGNKYRPAPCMHCQNAPCANVCPVGATFQTPEGVVLIDQQRCIGCRLCMGACPYDRRFFNWSEPVQLPEVKSAPYDIYSQMPAYKGTTMKCDLCIDHLSVGSWPMCVDGCPQKALWVGDLEEDVATNTYDVVALSDLLAQGNATRYKEELGTEPRVYYLEGDGQLASPPATDAFLKDKLEWPWREITQHDLDIKEGKAGNG